MDLELPRSVHESGGDLHKRKGVIVTEFLSTNTAVTPLTLYARNSNFPARIRCYKIKMAESSKHKTQFHLTVQ